MLRLTYWHWGGASNSPTENNGATSVIVIMPAAFSNNINPLEAKVSLIFRQNKYFSY
jgi:hypothetical protein